MHLTDTIQTKLTMKNFMEMPHGSGVKTGGPSALSQQDRQLFAKQLDYYLTSLAKQKNEKD